MNIADLAIPELQPAGMEEALTCYALYTLNQGIIPLFRRRFPSWHSGPLTFPKIWGT